MRMQTQLRKSCCGVGGSPNNVASVVHQSRVRGDEQQDPTLVELSRRWIY